MNTSNILLSTIIVIAIISSLAWGFPKYRVYTAEMRGRAEIARAEQNRKIRIEEAKAELEAQKLESQAEIVRAEGMAKAIEIENGNLTDKYIQYLWVRTLSLSKSDKVYIPTEANLPILEARK